MTSSALFLVIATGLGFAALDLLRKLLADRIAVVPLLLLMTGGAIPLYGGWAALSSPLAPSGAYLLPGLGSAVLNVVANLCFLRAVAVGGLSSTVPMLSLTPVLAALLAMPLLGEYPTRLEWAGIVMVVFGALLLNRPAAGRDPSERAHRQQRQGALLMATVAVTWSLAVPLDKLAMEHASPGFHGLVLNAVIFLSLLAYLGSHRRLQDLGQARGNWGLLILSVLCAAAALAAQLMALQLVFAGLVETLKRGIGSASALGLGAGLLGERIGLGKGVAVAMMTVGVAMVLL